jgi:hypothetical protein
VADLTNLTPCWCATCGRPVVTAGHTCDPDAPATALEGVVRMLLRRQLVEHLAKQRTKRGT